jgi:hypothetical protein
LYFWIDLPVEACRPLQPAYSVTFARGPMECLWQGGVEINLLHPWARRVAWGGGIYHLDQVGGISRQLQEGMKKNVSKGKVLA